MTSKRWLLLACAGVLTWTGASAVQADWDVGDLHKMHYPQLPDLTQTGLDVLATRRTVGDPVTWKLLADDWLCTETGPVGDVHIWGSWLGDFLPQLPGAGPDAGAVTFKLSVHANIPDPDGPTGPGFSMPGPELWAHIFTPGTFTVRPYASGVPEGFFDPNIPAIIGTDTVVWQYNFDFIPNPFFQQAGEIYWLDVQALSVSPGCVFGWKTTNPLDPRTPHFMDDATFTDTADFGTLPLFPWAPLVYPAGHPFEGQSIDLAFVITPEPASLALLLLGAGLLLRRRAA